MHWNTHVYHVRVRIISLNIHHRMHKTKGKGHFCSLHFWHMLKDSFWTGAAQWFAHKWSPHDLHVAQDCFLQQRLWHILLFGLGSPKSLQTNCLGCSISFLFVNISIKFSKKSFREILESVTSLHQSIQCHHIQQIFPNSHWPSPRCTTTRWYS